MSTSAATTATTAKLAPKPEPLERPSRSLSVGYLAMLPLLVAYEVAVWNKPLAPRNAGELWIDRILLPLGEHATLARWTLLAIGAVAAYAIARKRGVAIRAGIARVVLEGAGAACVLGPLMVIAVRALERYVPALDVSWDPSASPPSLVDTALVFGAGAWEELLFRVGAYSFVYWLALRFLSSLGRSETFARGSAELAGLTLSSLFFALAHFEPLTSRLGVPPRAFHAPLFSWLCLGGVLLGLLFRWRGPGVAAWAHGLFNVALWIGADPDVIW